MIEPIMYIGIGFLVAGLLVIGVIPLVHARAVRLTMRRLEALTPMSMAEIQADKDQLRAEFAMAMSRLEMTIEHMKAKTTSQLAEIGRKSEAIGRLKFELGEKTAAVLALEAKERQLTEDLRGLEGELAARAGALETTEGSLEGTQTELAQLSAQLHQNAMASEGQRVELAALRAQTEVLRNEIESYETEITELRDRLGKKTAEAAALSQQLGEERGRTEPLDSRVGELDRLLVAQSAEAEVLGRRVEELGAQLGEQGRLLADREYLAERLRDEAVAARNAEAELRAELTDADTRYRSATETLAAEKALIESELRRSHDERDKLQRELAALKRDVQSAIANEGAENAVLRERINEVAAQVVRLTATLEGPDSPIGTILEGGHAAAAPSGANGASPPAAPRAGETTPGTLADRIRALQGPTSRVARPSAEPDPRRGAGRSAQQRK
jgi:chromosome segregation ATPase